MPWAVATPERFQSETFVASASFWSPFFRYQFMGTVSIVRLLPGRYVKSLVNTAPPSCGQKSQSVEAPGTCRVLAALRHSSLGGS